MTSDGKLAKTVLVFMIQSTCSKYKDVVKIVPIENLNAELLLEEFHSVMESLKDTFFVIAVSTDNHVVNSIKSHYPFWHIKFLPDATIANIAARISEVIGASDAILRLLVLPYEACRRDGNEEISILASLKSKQNEQTCCQGYFCPDYVLHFPKSWEEVPRCCITIGGLHSFCLQYQALGACQVIERDREKIQSNFIHVKYGNPLQFCVTQLKKAVKRHRQRSSRKILKVVLSRGGGGNIEQLRGQLTLMHRSVKFNVVDNMNQITEFDKYIIMIAFQREINDEIHIGDLRDQMIYNIEDPTENCYGLLAVERCEIPNDDRDDYNQVEFFAHVFRKKRCVDGGFRYGRDNLEVFCLKEVIMKYSYLVNQPHVADNEEHGGIAAGGNGLPE